MYSQSLGQDPASDAAKIAATLAAARAGKATLTQLGEAYDLAGRLRLEAAREEIGQHIRGLTLPPRAAIGRGARFLGIGIGIGVLAGIATHFVLVAMGQRHIIGRRDPKGRPHLRLVRDEP